METLWLDLRHTVRSLGRTPAFTVIAVVSLSVGIGVNTAAFSALNAILFRPYPGVFEQTQLLDVKVGVTGDDGRNGRYATREEFNFYRENVTTFSSFAAAARMPIVARIDGEPELRVGEVVSANFFRTLGTAPTLGRFFNADEDARDANRVVVISDMLWERAFARSTEVIGKSISIAGTPFTVIGVTPREFFGTQPGEIFDRSNGAPTLYVPLGAATGALAVESAQLRMVGRLAAGTAPERARSDVQLVASRLAAHDPVSHRDAFATVGDLRIKSRGEAIGGALLVMCVPMLILIVTCANLANQMLARGIERGREIAVRLSLGASRGRLIRQLLTESALLAAVGASGGIALSMLIVRVVRSGAVAFPIPIELDVRVLVFTAIIAVGAVVMVALLPALRATRPNLASSLRSGAGDTTVGRSRLQSALVVTQVATSLALLTLTSLFTRAATHTEGTRMVAGATQLLTIPLNLDVLALDSMSGRALQRRVLDRVGAIPGVEAVGFAPFGLLESAPEERIALGGGERASRAWLDIGEIQGDWFTATGTRIVRGRAFDRGEVAGIARVSVVDEMAARKLWPGRDAIGQTLRIGADSNAIVTTVVGVVAERRVQLDQPAEGMAFIPGASRYHSQMSIVVRTSSVNAALAQELRRAVTGVDPRLPAPTVSTFADELAHQTAPVRYLASGLGVLGSVAIALAALGLYAVLSFLVAQRRREIGVRMALGAKAIDITRLVLGRAARLAGAGIMIGTGLAAAVAMLAQSLLFGLQPLDPIAFGGASLLFAIVMLVASATPARRASRVDPMVALRS